MVLVFDKYFTRAEEAKLLRYIAKHGDVLAKRDHAWIRFGLRTGARVETMALFTVGDAHYALQQGRIRFRTETLKGRKNSKKDHSISLTKERKKAINDLLKIRKVMGFDDDKSQSLIMGQKGQGMSIRSMQARIKEWAIGAGIRNAKKVSPHWLRHTCAKRIMAVSEAQDPRVSVMIELGHGSYESTVIYTRPDKENHEAAIREVC